MGYGIVYESSLTCTRIKLVLTETTEFSYDMQSEIEEYVIFQLK